MIVPKTEEKRVIDSNALAMRRLAELSEKGSHGADSGFVSGLAADVAEAPEESGGAGGSVIKASEDARTILEQAQSEAQSILAEAKLEAMRIRDRAMEQAELEKAQAVSRAKQEGYNDGYARAQAEGEAAKRELSEKERELEEEYRQLIDTLEPQFVDTITGIYEHIFHVELHSYREILVYLISSTLRKQEGGHEFIIHVSGEDYPYVNMQKRQIFAGTVSANCSIDVVEDLTLGKNECLIETENGIFDCGLGTQLAGLKSKLMLLAWSKEE